MTVLHGFELIREAEIKEINAQARLYRHKKTGARLLSLENDDENKVFGINFPTPPSDSTGLPHIMEHSVLCGSRKYPVKEPFVELLKGSLNTFLNAMTYPDMTCYPVASQNQQDFYNLIDVYLDAVFYPLIPPHTLQQEGWHYELEKVGDPLTYKGVVFNEMKGAYSTPENVLGEQNQHSLFPDTVYSHDSGGDPEVIPLLTYEQFKTFHETFYHPSNAYIFVYGNDDPQERLRILNAYLDEFTAQEVQAEVPLQKTFNQPRRLVVPYDAGNGAVGDAGSVEAASENAPKAFISMNWLLEEAKDPEHTLAMAILSNILVQTPASPLRKALLDSGLGEDLTGRGLETYTRQMFFSTGLKGVKRENVDQVEKLILETLKDLADKGIDPNTTEASLNTVEFRLRENNTGSFPRGLALMLRALSTWIHGGDPFAPLAFESPLSAIRKKVEDGELYFEELIRKFLLQNNHRTTVILEPEQGLGSRRDAAERKRLEQARRQMGEQELASLVENTEELKRLQEAPDSPEALATIPMLKREDLDKDVKRVPLEVEDLGGRPVLFHDIFTNGILYLDVGFDLGALPSEWVSYVPLFAQGLVEMGTAKEDYVQLSQRIGRATGGLTPAWFTSASEDGGAAWLFLRGKATVSRSEDLLQILDDVLKSVRWDNRERFRQIVLEAKAEREAILLQLGHQYINRRIKAHFNPYDWAAEEMSGINGLLKLRALAEQIDQDWPAVLNILEGIQSRLLNKENLLLNITVDGESWAQIRPQAGDFIAGLPSVPVGRNHWSTGGFPEAEGFSIPAQVNYVGKGANLYQTGYKANGSVLVIAPYLRNTYLWEKVRVQGGAYGGFCVFDRHSGIFNFLSYRDPNLKTTLEVYKAAGQFLSRLDLSESELSKAIIGAIGDMDAYQLPDAQGYSSMLRYLIGETDDKRQQLRDQILSTTQEDFRSFGAVLDQVKEAGVVAVLGSADALQAARESGEVPLEVIKVM